MRRKNIHTIEINGEAYSFKMGNWELALIEERFDTSIFEVIKNGMSIRYLIGILFIGLKNTNMFKSEEDVADLINPQNLKELTVKTAELIMSNIVDIPESKDDGKGN